MLERLESFIKLSRWFLNVNKLICVCILQNVLNENHSSKASEVTALLREATKKNRKKSSQQKFWCVNLKKSAFFRANFPKNMLKLIHNVPFVCQYKIQSLNSYKIMNKWTTSLTTVHSWTAICTLIGWFKSSRLYSSLSGFCASTHTMLMM